VYDVLAIDAYCCFSCLSVFLSVWPIVGTGGAGVGVALKAEPPPPPKLNDMWSCPEFPCNLAAAYGKRVDQTRTAKCL